jgi:Fe-S-cluster containining protein
MRNAWARVSARFEAYRLVMPGSPRFICQPEVCTAYCCHAYSVSLGDAEVARFRHFEGLEPVEFLELDEDSKPIMLPMAEPYVLARQDNHCKMLSPELGCSAYHGRPNACRLYPHFVVFWDTVEHRAVTIPTDETAAAFDWARDGHPPPLLPMLLGHAECPGFTGEPLSEEDWRDLFESTYQLQYEPPSDWPPSRQPESVTLETEAR